VNWLNVQTINWSEPLAFAERYKGSDLALLYSGMREQQTGDTSYLFLEPIACVEPEELDAFLDPIANDSLPDWIGYMAYEMQASTMHSAPCIIDMPRLRFIRYKHMLRFDHTAKKITHFARESLPLPVMPENAITSPQSNKIQRLESNFTRAQYESSIQKTIEHIHAGDFYQANITRKFYGEFEYTPDYFSLFVALTKASPAPFSAYIQHQGNAILSASPEAFLHVDSGGHITTRPIKGSARRGRTEEEDRIIRNALAHSSKNHAENLMIVDLMRNDLARVSLPQSVTVTEQSGLYSYTTIHHLISTIRAQKRDDASVMDIVRACFPPGSMTGAPKIAAMEWCATQEKMARGVYSGAIGWFGGKNTCDLSVVIRTLIMDGNRFEFQVGGGIVADSTPADEWQETMTKARGICLALGINEADLAAL
jgi:para-aminobenzoate synthetase component I